MDHTFRDVANDIGVTSVAVFQHYKRLKNKLSKHTKRSKNRIILDDKAYYRLLNSFKRIHKANANSKANLTALRMLKAELKDKDKSINDLTKQNSNLTEMLKHQQELQLNEQKRNKKLGQTLSRTLKLNYKKHGFWWRFAHLFSR